MPLSFRERETGMTGGGRLLTQAEIREARAGERATAEAKLGREFKAEQAGLQRGHELQMGRERFERKAAFAKPFLEQLATGADLAPGAAPDAGVSESERILQQAATEASQRDINRLQDVLSGAGILSSGTLAVGTGEILGRARGEVAKGLAGAAESRLTRRHQRLLAKRQEITNLVRSILV